MHVDLFALVEQARNGSFNARQKIAADLSPVKRVAKRTVERQKATQLAIFIADSIVEFYPDLLPAKVTEHYLETKIREHEVPEEEKTTIGHMIADLPGNHELDPHGNEVGRAAKIYLKLMDRPVLLKEVDNAVNRNPLVATLCHASEAISRDVVHGKALLYPFPNVAAEILNYPIATLRMISEEPAVLRLPLKDYDTVGDMAVARYELMLSTRPFTVFPPAQDTNEAREAVAEVYETVRSLGYQGTLALG